MVTLPYSAPAHDENGPLRTSTKVYDIRQFTMLKGTSTFFAKLLVINRPIGMFAI